MSSRESAHTWHSRSNNSMRKIAFDVPSETDTTELSQSSPQMMSRSTTTDSLCDDDAEVQQQLDSKFAVFDQKLKQALKEQNPLFPIDVESIEIPVVARRTRVKVEKESRDLKVTDVRVKEGIKLLAEGWSCVKTPFLSVLAEENAKIPKSRDEKSKLASSVLKTVSRLPLYHYPDADADKPEEGKQKTVRLDDKLVGQPRSLDTFKEVYDGSALPNGKAGAYPRSRLFHALQPQTLDIIGYDRGKPARHGDNESRVELCVSVQNVHEPLVATLCVYDAKWNEKLSENFVALCGPDDGLFGKGGTALSRCVLPADCTSDATHVLVLLTKLMQGDYDDIVSFYSKTNPSSKDSDAYKGKLREIASLATCTQTFGIAEVPCKSINGADGNAFTLKIARIKDNARTTVEKLFSATPEKHIKYFPDAKVELTVKCLNSSKEVPSGYGRDHLLRELKHTEKDKKAQYVEVLAFAKSRTSAASVPLLMLGGESRYEEAKELREPALEYYDIVYFSPECANFSDYSGACSARNILVEAEVRPSDAADAPALPVFVRPTPYGEEFSTTAEFPVQYHTRKPTFSLFDQVKISLPKDVSTNFHLVVSFYHVDCKWKKGADVKTKVGVCAIPLFTAAGRIASGNGSVRILPELPADYMRDIHNDEQEKPQEGLVFSYAFKVVSSVHSTFAEIDNLMRFSELTKGKENEARALLNSFKRTMPDNSQSERTVMDKRLLNEMVLFSPYILRCLFKLSASDKEIGREAFEVLVMFIDTIKSYSQTALDHYAVNLRSSEKFMELIERVNEYRLRQRLKSSTTMGLMAAVWKSVALAHKRRKQEAGGAQFAKEEIDAVSDFLVSVAREVSQIKVVGTNDELVKELGVFVGNLFYVFPVSSVFSLIHRILYGLCGQSATAPTLVPLACCTAMTLRGVRSVSRFVAVLSLHPSFVGLGFPGSSPRVGATDAGEFASMETYCEQHYLAGTIVSLLSFIDKSREMTAELAETVFGFFYRLDAEPEAPSATEKRVQEARRRVIARLFMPMLTLVIEKHKLLEQNDREHSDTNFFVGVGLGTSKYCVHLAAALWLMKEMDTETLKWFFANKVSMDGLKKLVKMFGEVQSELLVVRRGDESVPLSPSAENVDAPALGQTARERAPDLARTSTPAAARRFTSKSIGMTKCTTNEAKLQLEKSLFRTANTAGSTSQSINSRVSLSAKLRGEAARMGGALRFEASAVMLDTLLVALASRFPEDTRVEKDAITAVLEFVIAMNSEQQSDDFNRLTFEAYHRVVSPFKNYFFVYRTPLSSQMVSKLVGFANKTDDFQVVASSLLFNMIVNNFYAAKNFYRMRLRMTVSVSELSGKKDVHSFAGIKSCLDAISQRICAPDAFGSDDSARIDEEARAIEAEKIRGGKVHRNGKILDYALKNVQREARAQAARNVRDLNAQFSKTAKAEMSDLRARLLSVVESCERRQQLENDPEATCDLFYHISEEFVDSPDLRVAWLNNLAQVHLGCGNYDQYVQTRLLVALLVAKYLTLLGRFTDTPVNAESWRRVSPYCDPDTLGLPAQERLLSLRDDICTGEEFSFEGFRRIIEDAVAKQKSGCFRERCVEIYHLLLPYYIDQRDFASQEPIYAELHKICHDFVTDPERIIPNYYRVGFYGKSFGELNGRMFVYSSRLRLPDFVKHISEQFGKDGTELEVAPNSKTPAELTADASKNFVQICNVLKYLDGEEQRQKSKLAEIDLHFGVSRFVLTLPVPGKTEHDTRKKQTLYYAKGKFPGIFARLEIDQSRTVERVIAPIDVSRELVEEKYFELERELSRKQPDAKRLQMLLTGSLLATVNLGPLKIVEHYFVDNDPHESTEQDALVRLGRKMIEFGSTLRKGIDLNKNCKTDATSKLCDELEHAMNKYDSTVQQYVTPFCTSDGQ